MIKKKKNDNDNDWWGKKNSPQYHSQKHPTTRGPHPHTIANSEIHTNSVSRGGT